MERAAAQELSQERGWRQIIIRYSLEILQELQQAVSLSKFLTILRHLLEQRLCLHLENRQLIEHRRVQHGIGILLEWEIHLFSPDLTDGQRRMVSWADTPLYL